METACFVDGLNFSIISFQFDGRQPAAEHRGNLPGRSKFIEGNNNYSFMIIRPALLILNVEGKLLQTDFRNNFFLCFRRRCPLTR